MNSELWNLTANAIKSINDAPPWLREQACMTFDSVTRLPNLDRASDGQTAIPSIEEKVVRGDYLDFLREQIKMEPRGPQWNDILKKRLLALEPFVNKSVVTALFFKKPNVITLRIDPSSGTLFHVEYEMD